MRDPLPLCPRPSADARGLIRWMLMVNPERRATVEDIASHWWVNWGCKSSVCDCDPPMLAPFIRRQGRADPPKPPEPAPLPHQRPKKAKKENEAAAEEKPELKRPKSILKTRLVGSFHSQGALDPAALPLAQEGVSASSPEREEEDEEPALAEGSPPKIEPCLPKKGILKNSGQRESGYYSSPERSESSEQLGGATLLSRSSSPPKRPARKSILKRNGKYSARGGSGAGGEDSGLSRSQSRPSSMVGEEGDPGTPLARPSIRPCVSAQNLLQLAGFGGERGGRARGRRGSPTDNGSFSLLEDLDDVTQVYQQALDISGSLS